MKLNFYTTFFCLIILGHCQKVYSQTEWAYSTGGDYTSFFDSDETYSVCVDLNGNTYITGIFDGNSDFDNGPDELLFSAIGSMHAFVVKLDINGQLVWAKDIGGNGETYGYSIKVDNQNNVLIAGVFKYTTDFDPNNGIQSISSNNNSYDVFLLKLDIDGNFLWVNTYGSFNSETCNSIIIDSNTNVYITGSYSGTVDFDLSPENNLHTSNGIFDVFIMKVNPNGSLNWVKTIGGNIADRSYGIAIDNNNSVYVSGEFGETVDFDPGSGIFELTTMGQLNGYVIKLDSTGEFQWARSFESNSSSQVKNITIDDSKNAYLTGHYHNQLNVNPSVNGSELLSNGWSRFIISIDSMGQYLWGKSIQDFWPNAITISESDYLFITGSFDSIADFDSGNETYYLTSLGNYSGFVMKSELSGSIQWAKPITSLYGAGGGHAIAIDQYENIYVGGTFANTFNFGIDQSDYSLTAVGLRDAFVFKLGNLTNLSELEKTIKVYPNPFIDQLNIEYQSTETISVELVNILGEVMSTYYFTESPANLDLSQLSSGVYFMRFDGELNSIKLIKE